MKATLVWFRTAATIGVAAGAALGYWEAKPWTVRGGKTVAKQGDPAATDAEKEAASTAAKAAIDETTFYFYNMTAGTAL